MSPSYLIRVRPEVLPSIARTIDLLERLHDMFDVNCQQQIDDLTEILQTAQPAGGALLRLARERGLMPDDEPVGYSIKAQEDA
jgi:hypothetical protein